jgi:DnaJ-class molecular chaperone
MNNEKETCSRCNGSGRIPCPACGGSGTAEQLNEGYEKREKRIVSCASCHGAGSRTCGSCGGSGKK